MSANVNKPTNKKEKEADVNRKLQLYGIINAFQNGKVPSVSSLQRHIDPTSWLNPGSPFLSR